MVDDIVKHRSILKIFRSSRTIIHGRDTPRFTLSSTSSVYNYNHQMVQQPTYFRQYDGRLAVDIFDRLWFVDGEKMRKTQQRVRCAYHHSMPYHGMWTHGYLTLSHKGVITFHEFGSHRTLLRKRIHALDIKGGVGGFIYRTKKEYRVANMAHDIAIAQPFISVHDAEAHIVLSSNPHVNMKWHNDTRCNISGVKKAESIHGVIYYLTGEGEIHVVYQDDRVICSGVKDYVFYQYDLYILTLNNELRRLAKGRRLFKYPLRESVKRIEVGVNGILLEYERTK